MSWTVTTTYEALTPKEEEVLDLVRQGKTNKEIAEIQIISVHTAKAHVQNLLCKTGTHNRTALAVWAAGRRASSDAAGA